MSASGALSSPSATSSTYILKHKLQFRVIVEVINGVKPLNTYLFVGDEAEVVYCLPSESAYCTAKSFNMLWRSHVETSRSASSNLPPTFSKYIYDNAYRETP